MLHDRSAMAYWDALASGKWRIAPPLSPSAEDVARYEQHAQHALRASERKQALMLGLTPAIAGMRWPQGTQLAAADWSAGMIRALAREPAQVLRADWRELPLADASQDFVIGDGCLTAMGDVHGIAQLLTEVRRVLAPGAMFCVRCFCRPPQPPVMAQVFDDLLSGRLANLDLFRWLLAMAVQPSAQTGVSLRAVWNQWHAQVPEGAAALAMRLGWSADALANIERWARLDTRYVFATLEEVRALAAPSFEIGDCAFPQHEYPQLFPILLLRAK